MFQDPKKRSFFISLSLHVVVVSCLVFSFKHTKFFSSSPSVQEKPIIDAVVVNSQAIKKETQRLENIRKQKIAKEEARKREIARKEKALEEEKRLALEKEAQALQLAQEEQAKKEKLEKEKKEKEKIEKVERERIEKEKVEKERAERIEKEKVERIEREKIALEESKKQAVEAQRAKLRVSEHAKNEYMAFIQGIIHQHWSKPVGFSLTGLSCIVLVDLLPTGEVIRVSITRSSGNLVFDRSAEVAVYKASPIPMPSDPVLAKEARQLEFLFNPEVV